jgi:Flp pilus assembly protein TadD
LARKEKFLHLPEVLGLYLLSLQGNEQRDKSLSYQESERARERYWAAGWGKRPLPFSRNPFVVQDLSEQSRMDQAEILKQQGVFFFSQGDHLGAEKAFRLALDRNPQDPAGLVSLGKICFERQHFKNALAHLQKATQMDPSNRDAWMGLALVAQRMNNKSLAKEAYRQARRLDSPPPSPNAERDSGPLEKPAALRNPKDLNDLGEALYSQGKIEAAMEQFQKSLEADPHYLPAMNNLGVVFFHRGERDKAVDWFQRALTLAPGYPEALENLSQCRGLCGETVPSRGSESRIKEAKI